MTNSESDSNDEYYTWVKDFLESPTPNPDEEEPDRNRLNSFQSGGRLMLTDQETIDQADATGRWIRRES